MELDFFAKSLQSALRNYSIYSKADIICYFFFKHFTDNYVLFDYSIETQDPKDFQRYCYIAHKFSILAELFPDRVISPSFSNWIDNILNSPFGKCLTAIYEGKVVDMSQVEDDTNYRAEEFKDAYFCYIPSGLKTFEHNFNDFDEVALKKACFYCPAIAQDKRRIYRGMNNLSKKCLDAIYSALWDAEGGFWETDNSKLNYLKYKPEWLDNIISLGPTYRIKDLNKRYSDNCINYGSINWNKTSFDAFILTDYEYGNKYFYYDNDNNYQSVVINLCRIALIPECSGLSVYEFSCNVEDRKFVLALIAEYFCSNIYNKRAEFREFIEFISSMGGISFRKTHTVRGCKKDGFYLEYKSSDFIIR